MAAKDWTFDISKLALGKPLTPVSFGMQPQNTATQPKAPTAPYDPFGAFKSPSLPSGSSTFMPGGSVPLPTTQAPTNMFNPAGSATQGISPLPNIGPTAPGKSLQDKLVPPLPTNTNVQTALPASLQKGAMVSPPVATPAPTNTSVATPAPASLSKGPMSAATPTPTPSTSVATPAPTSLAKGAVDAKTGAAIDPKAKPTEPVQTPPVSPFQDAYTKAMAELKAIVTQDDPRYKAAVNQFITNSSLMDQADRDMLKMQINQDPNLRGQGAGIALMQVLNRDQRFSLDQGIAQLSNANLERIVNLQKYGLETGLKITEAYNAQKKDAFNTLLTNGQFGAAASTLQSIFDEQFPSLGLKVDADSLKSRDPFTLNQMATKLDFVKSLASSNPAAALPIVQSLLTDPQFKDYFPAGMTAEQVIQSFAMGQVPQNLVLAQGVQKTINELAASGQSFDETGNSYAELFRLMGRNAVTKGRELTLESINSLRAAQGLPAFQQGADGSIVDDQGNPLDDQDYTELAYRKDYQDRVTKSSEKPWEAVYKQLLGTPGLGEKLLKPELYPGANDAVKKVLAGISLGTDLFYKDPSTGLWSLDMNKANLSMSNPELQPYFMNWPTAAFNPDGTVAAFTPGGYVYGEIVNGKPILSTPEDEALDQAYFAYRNTGGTLDPTAWYFATQGGKAVKPNEAMIPEQYRPKGEDFQNVGTTLVKGAGPATGVSTEAPQPGTLASLDAAKAKLTESMKSLPPSVKQSQIELYLDGVSGSDSQASKDLSTALAFIAKDQTLPGYAANKTTQAGKDYAAFVMMVKGGLPEAKAAELLILAIGDRFKTSYKALTGKEWV
jgi:hypothetical protein